MLPNSILILYHVQIKPLWHMNSSSSSNIFWNHANSRVLNKYELIIFTFVCLDNLTAAIHKLKVEWITEVRHVILFHTSGFASLCHTQ